MTGVFRVSDNYTIHPSGSSHRQRLTGVLMVPGLAPTPAEVDADSDGKWVGQRELPVTVDRADPSNIRVEWQDVPKWDPQAAARQRAADEADRLAGGPPPTQPGFGVPTPGQPGFGGVTTTSGPGWTSTTSTTTYTTGGAGLDLNEAIGAALRQAGMDPSRMHVSGPPEVTVVNGGAGAAGAEELFARFFGTPPGTPGTPQGAPGSAALEDATGVVVAAHDVLPGVEPRGPGSSLVELTLDVTRANGQTYSVTTRIGFSTPARRAAVATVGTRLPVKVSPANPGLVTVDVAQLNLP